MYRSLLFVLLATGISLSAFSQTSIKPEEAIKHVGDSVKVCGKIYGGIYLANSKTQLTLLNMGGNYPNAPLTIVIGPDLRSKLGYQPEVKFKEKDVCVTGKVILYKEKPEIEITDSNQLKEQ